MAKHIPIFYGNAHRKVIYIMICIYICNTVHFLHAMLVPDGDRPAFPDISGEISGKAGDFKL